MNNKKVFSPVIDKTKNQQNTKISQDDARKAHGRKLWDRLHRQAYNYRGNNDSAFIAQFGREIPRFMTGCSCNEFWNRWISKNPPKYGINEYFEWTVKCHNAVNIKLGKPVMSLEDAIKTMQ